MKSLVLSPVAREMFARWCNEQAVEFEAMMLQAQAIPMPDKCIGTLRSEVASLRVVSKMLELTQEMSR